MQQIQLNEPAIAAVKQRLEDGLADVVDTINAETSDEISLPQPYEILDYLPTPNVLNDTPTIGIGDGPTTFEDDLGHYSIGRHELLIVVYVQHEDQRQLAWQLRRYLQAITRVVLDQRNLGDGGWGTTLIGTRPGDTLGDVGSDPDSVRSWLSWAGVAIRVKGDED